MYGVLSIDMQDKQDKQTKHPWSNFPPYGTVVCTVRTVPCIQRTSIHLALRDPREITVYGLPNFRCIATKLPSWCCGVLRLCTPKYESTLQSSTESSSVGIVLLPSDVLTILNIHSETILLHSVKVKRHWMDAQMRRKTPPRKSIQ